MNFRRILAFVLIVGVCAGAFDADAKRRRKKVRKKTRTTKVVMKKPTASGPLSETEPFVVFDREHPVTKGLDNRVIALWQSHGKYYDQGQQAWKWQRPRLFGTVEDLFAQGYVMPYLMPMLENAGAYVMSPRERDTSLTEIIVDTDGYPEGDFYLKQGEEPWKEGIRGSGFAYSGGRLVDGQNPFTNGTSETVATVSEEDEAKQSVAAWNADMPQRGKYAVYVSYASHPNSATDARYTINHLGGSTTVTVNQQMGGGTWIYLGHYDLAKGKQQKPIVELSNVSACDDAVVSADAVKIGGGMGNVARSPKGEPDLVPVTSDAPRFTEGARYWLQWAGMPQKVYSESNGENDYTDDYKSRALWVNYLAGGSPMLPDSAG
ncbi:MAG: xanthan lyase, partial [Muribaculaceae bacterium]|nr:xanthan lyase [Muribaculaceae bacterium]